MLCIFGYFSFNRSLSAVLYSTAFEKSAVCDLAAIAAVNSIVYCKVAYRRFQQCDLGSSAVIVFNALGRLSVSVIPVGYIDSLVLLSV